MMSTDEPIESKIEAQLHTANLRRLRGDLEDAQIACMAVLQKSPSQPDALALLGDIKFEGGDLQDAVHWYGLALSESPSRPGLPEKLARAQAALRSQESDAGAAQIGLPTRQWPAWAFPASLVVAACLVGLAAFLAGTKNAAPSVYREPISVPSPPAATNADMPVRADEPNGTTQRSPSRPTYLQNTTASDPTSASGLNSNSDGTSSAPSTVPVAGSVADDLPKLRDIPGVQFATVDPRSGSATLSAQASGGPNFEPVAASLAAEAFSRSPNLTRVTIELDASENAPVYIADFTHDNASKAQNEWTAPGSAPPAQ